MSKVYSTVDLTTSAVSFAFSVGELLLEGTGRINAFLQSLNLHFFLKFFAPSLPLVFLFWLPFQAQARSHTFQGAKLEAWTNSQDIDFWVISTPIDTALDSDRKKIFSNPQKFNSLQTRVHQLGGAIVLPKTPDFYHRWFRDASVYFETGPLREDISVSPYHFILVLSPATSLAAIAHEEIHIRDGLSGVKGLGMEWLAFEDSTHRNWLLSWIFIGQSELNAYWEGSLPFRQERNGSLLTWKSYEELLYMNYWAIKTSFAKLVLRFELRDLLGFGLSLIYLMGHIGLWGVVYFTLSLVFNYFRKSTLAFASLLSTRA